MNTLFLTLKDKILGYKHVYDKALQDSGALLNIISAVSEVDIGSMDYHDIVLTNDQIDSFASMFNEVDGLSLSVPGSNSIIKLTVRNTTDELSLCSSDSEIIRILKQDRRLLFGQTFMTLGGANSMQFDEFVEGVSGQFLINELMAKLSSYVVNPNATVDGACSLVRSVMNGNASLMETCDSLEQYFLNSPDVCTAFLSFVIDQKKVLNNLTSDDTNGTISFSDDYVVSNTFSIPLRVVGEVASAILSGVIALFSPVIGVITYATSRVVGKVVDYVKSNLGTSSVVYTSEYDAPTYAQPLLQYKQKLTDTSPVNINQLVNDLDIDISQDWVIKTYWYGVCILIWSNPKENTFCIEGYLIPLWYPVREGGGNVTYEGDDMIHTLSGFWAKLTSSHNLPVEFRKDTNNLPQFRLNKQGITDSKMQELWSIGEISPSKFSTLSEFERMEAVKQSMFWWGLLMIPSSFIGTPNSNTSDWVSYNPKELFASPSSYNAQLWKMAFAISLSAMMEYDYQEASLNPLFSLNRDWDILSTFKQLQEYLVAFKTYASEVMTKTRNTLQSNTGLISSVSPYGILNNERDTIFATIESNCAGIHLLYPPEYTHNVWMQAIVMLVTVAAVATTAIIIKKVVVKKIRAAVFARKMRIQAQQQQLLASYASGNYDKEATLNYVTAKMKSDKWDKMLNLGKYDITGNTSNIQDNSSVLDYFGDLSKLNDTIGKTYKAITGVNLF